MVDQLLRVPGLGRLYLACVVGRLPLGALGLLFILRVREMTGSYAAGGAAAGAFAIAAGVGSPLLGRLVDRRGQGLVLTAGGLWAGAMLLVFAALPDGTGTPVALALAAAAGVTMPPLGACQRAIWSEVLEPRLRHKAYTLDAVVFELVYIAGPLLLVGVVGGWSLPAAFAVAGAATTTGALAFAATRLSREWQPHPERSTDPWGPLRGAGVRTVLLALALFAVGIGAVEIAVAAFAEREGSPNAVGVLLGLWGAGSMAGGIVAARLPPPPDPGRRLALLLGALALSQVPMLLAGSLVTMGAAITLAGVAIAPGLALAFRLLSEVAPHGTVTEAQSWTASAFGAGIAAGSAGGGWLVEHAGLRLSLALAVAAGVAAAALVAARRGTLPHDGFETPSELVAA